MKSIDGKKVKELLEKKQAFAVDVDSAIDFKKNHIMGATNIPHSEKDFIKQVERKFAKKTENVVLCANRDLSTQLDKLGQELEKAGYKNVYQYKAGPTDWKNSNLSIQRQ